MAVGGQRHAPAALPPGKTLYPFYRRLVWTGTENLAPTVFRSPDHPAGSKSLCRPTSKELIYNNLWFYLSERSSDVGSWRHFGDLSLVYRLRCDVAVWSLCAKHVNDVGSPSATTWFIAQCSLPVYFVLFVALIYWLRGQSSFFKKLTVVHVAKKCPVVPNSNAHFRLHKSRPLVPVLSQINPVHAPPILISVYLFNGKKLG